MSPTYQILLHSVWRFDTDTAPPKSVMGRLPTYTTRYAQTLGVAVHAVGVADDHIHLLFDHPPDRTIADIVTELRSATARFLRDTIPDPAFRWADEVAVCSVAPDQRDDLKAYIIDNAAIHLSGPTQPEWEIDIASSADSLPLRNEIPLWLRDAMAGNVP